MTEYAELCERFAGRFPHHSTKPGGGARDTTPERPIWSTPGPRALIHEATGPDRGETTPMQKGCPSSRDTLLTSTSHDLRRRWDLNPR
ncbi:hypothetical protein CQW39_08190 [Streptomyces griseofuscus]|nr:hypothetical protein CQW39_08190 [Streptomyces griseofuscus]